MKARLRQLWATVRLIGACLITRTTEIIDIAADILEAECGNHLPPVIGLGFIWEFGGVACALAKMPETYGVGGLIGIALIRLIAVIMIPLGAVTLVSAGRLCARKWHAQRKQDS